MSSASTLSKLLWFTGCANISISWGISAYAFHSKTLEEKPKGNILRGVHMHQFASLGFMALAMKGAPLLPTAILAAGTACFPGVLYYENFTGNKIPLRLVPMGGTLQMLFWLVLGIY